MTVPCARTGPVFSMEAVPWMAELQTFAVEQVHAIFNAVTLNNCHSAVTGTGGTIRPNAWSKFCVLSWRLTKSQTLFWTSGVPSGTLSLLHCWWDSPAAVDANFRRIWCSVLFSTKPKQGSSYLLKTHASGLDLM